MYAYTHVNKNEDIARKLYPKISTELLVPKFETQSKNGRPNNKKIILFTAIKLQSTDSSNVSTYIEYYL